MVSLGEWPEGSAYLDPRGQCGPWDHHHGRAPAPRLPDLTFQDDGHGGTNVVQDAGVMEQLQDRLGIVQNQHISWQNAHREMYQHFNP
jgi:hypothetical protein